MDEENGVWGLGRESGRYHELLFFLRLPHRVPVAESKEKSNTPSEPPSPSLPAFPHPQNDF